MVTVFRSSSDKSVLDYIYDNQRVRDKKTFIFFFGNFSPLDDWSTHGS